MVWVLGFSLLYCVFSMVKRYFVIVIVKRVVRQHLIVQEHGCMRRLLYW